MSKNPIRIDDFVDATIKWTKTGAPRLESFSFYEYMEIPEYRSALESNSEWKRYILSAYDIVDYRERESGIKPKVEPG